MVEDVHFKLAWGTPEALGARALTVNLSDIAAMGGKPTVCVVNLAVRDGLGLRFFDRMYQGLRKAAARAEVEVVGGNITRAGALAITIALLGEVRGAALRRDAARPGDTIYVTGTLGDAAAGTAYSLGHGSAPRAAAARKFLVDRFLQPTARLKAGLALARIKPAPAAIDLSDGLWQDLGHVLERSGVGAEIDAGALPLSAAYRATPRRRSGARAQRRRGLRTAVLPAPRRCGARAYPPPGRAREPYRPHNFLRQAADVCWMRAVRRSAAARRRSRDGTSCARG